MSQDARTALAEFAQSRDEAAFRRVVDEFGGIVLRAALRRTGEMGLAEEVAQNVFAIMARKAKRIARHPSISGWVFTTTRLEAAKALRGRQRHRRKLEALAEEIKSAPDMSDDDLEQWRDALPHLEEGIDKLAEAERAVLLARFFEGKSYGEIAGESGKSEAACKMRVRRSLDKLNGWMTRRGVTLSGTALAAGLAAEWAKAAPAALTASISAKAVAAAPAIGAGTIITNTLLTMDAIKSAGVAAAAVLAIGAVPLAVQHSQAESLERELAELKTEAAGLDPIRSGAPSGLRGGGVRTPAQRFLENAKIPEDPVEFIDMLLAAVMEQNMAAMIRTLIPLSRLTPDELEELMVKVRESDASTTGKQMVMPMLMAFADADGQKAGEMIDRALEEGMSPGSIVGNLARWTERDPAAAVAWYRQRRDEGKLAGKGLGDSPERYILMALVPALAKSDPDAAIALLDGIDPNLRDETLGSLVGTLIGQGEAGRERGRGVLISIEDRTERLQAFAIATSRFGGGITLDEAATLARSLDFDERGLSTAYGSIAQGRRDLPLEERGSWLAGQIGAGPPLGMRQFVAAMMRVRSEGGDVSAWVDTLPPGAVRDEALLGEFDVLLGMRNKTGEAIARVRAVGDQDKRTAATQEGLVLLRGRDPQAAAETALELGVEIPE